MPSSNYSNDREEPPSATEDVGSNLNSIEYEDSAPVTTEDLIPLIRAIIFKYPEYNNAPTKIHQEIVSVASRMEPILSTISLEAVETAFEALNQLREDREQGTLKLHTIGSTPAVDIPVSVAVTNSTNVETEVKWANLLLDVPADKSGQRPHQAFINYNANNEDSNDDNKPQHEDQNVFIVKIQVAKDGVEEKAPMLLYNFDRTLKTFIHFDQQGIFETIQDKILNNGMEGALGKSGGTKGYFYAKKCSDDTKISNNIAVLRYISVNCTEMAPDQSW